MLEEGQNLVYYLTVANEFYPMPAMPDGVEEGILEGIYKFSSSSLDKPKARAHLLGSGAILNECLKARTLLEENFGVAVDVWSVTSYKNLYWDALDVERTNRLNPEKKPRTSFLQRQTAGESGVFVAASDYLKALPETIARHLPGPVAILGTDGYGRSETREALRDFFEVDARHIAFAALAALVRGNALPRSVVKKARNTFKIDPERSNPLFA
jgi:pyruvate dehydrogenase E1 component